ncbi:MAG: bifunctional 3-deoxy-7-phosphoheptulonate synthase/chorismate mutase type II [Desulfobacteraceae bacterium]|nr:bifunctional 3-deoxy-7-phosphoheptulonate synthase/chorismate mutase type II [Desulfobacteraceae bacterium]
MNTNKFSDWNLPVGNIFVVSGPCSAESEDQIIQTARSLQKCDVNLFRAGIWKPRTRPGSFEGVGTRGLKWLKKVKEIVGMPVTTEVANSTHVEECLNHDIDILWIGARTTVNPFSVQNIADALKGVDIPVMVKNPINPELDLWIGAVERLDRAGITKLAAIHRGFSSFRGNTYRNKPNWKIPIELRRRLPDLPMICDPSHICGNRELLLSVSRQAMDLLFDGLMIESHIDPDSALSDAFQQITPGQLHDMLNRIVVKRLSGDEKDIDRIESLRNKIDDVDSHIIELIARRMEFVLEIGRYKMENNIAILQPNRWEEIVRSRISAGRMHNLSKEFILSCYQYIHEESIIRQIELTENK